MKLKNFIWDFDGTIMDTYHHSTRAFFDTMTKYGIKAEYDDVISLLRHSFSSVKAAYGLTDNMYEEFYARALVLFFEPMPTLYSGIEEVLKAICDKGGKNFIYTNRDDTALKYLEHYGLIKYFTDFVYNGCDSYERKPSGKSVKYLINKYSLGTNDCAMVGDRELDILSGKAAGIKGILFDEFNKYTDTQAAAVVYNIADVKGFIK